MKAVTVAIAEDGARSVQFNAEYPDPQPGPGEVLLRVLHAGICGTDMEILQGYKGLHKTQVLGHEFVARLAGFGDGVAPEHRARLSGDALLVAEINCVAPGSRSRTAAERAQDPCRSAAGIFGKDGVFAQFVALPAENVHVVPAGVPADRAVFTEPVAAAAQIAEQVHIPPSHSVAVLGAGRLGCVIAMVLHALGKSVTVLARRKLPPGLDMPVLQLAEVDVSTLENAYDVVVDCTGNPLALCSAIDFVKPRGTIVLKSTSAGTPERRNGVDLSPVVVKEITIVGSRCGPFPVALRLLKELKVETLISRRFNLEDAADAFAVSRTKGTHKVLLDIS